MTLREAFILLGPFVPDNPAAEAARDDAAALVMGRLRSLARGVLRGADAEIEDAVAITLHALVRAPRRSIPVDDGGVDGFLITALRRNLLMVRRSAARQLPTVDRPVEPEDAPSGDGDNPEWLVLQDWVRDLLGWAREELQSTAIPGTHAAFPDPELAAMFATSIEALRRILAGQESLDDAVVRLLEPPPTATKRGTLRRRMSRARSDIANWLDRQVYSLHQRLALDEALNELRLRPVVGVSS